MYGFAEIFIYWHEILPKSVFNYIYFLDAYLLKRSDDIRRFRRDLHNILDWGLNPKRVAGLEQMVRDIAAIEAAET